MYTLNISSEFIIAARTKENNNELSSLRGILSSIDRYIYLARCEYGKRLFIYPRFMRLRDTSKAKQKELEKTRRSLVKYFFSTQKEILYM